MSIVVRFLHWRKHRQSFIDGKPPSKLRTRSYFPYVSRMIMATPPWVNNTDLRRLDRDRMWHEKKLGGKYTLDHIIPLRHPRVCGLNVPWNLRVIPHEENVRKGNSWCQWHGELFDIPEQFNLALHPQNTAPLREQIDLA